MVSPPSALVPGFERPLGRRGLSRGRLLREVRRRPLPVLGAAIVLAITLAALAANLVAPYPPNEIHLGARLGPPGAAYPLGADQLGRDVLSRVIHGARVSLLVALGATGLSILASTALALTSGYLGGGFDLVLQRLVDAALAFPWLVLVLSLLSILGTGLGSVILVLGLSQTFQSVRVVRSTVLQVRELAYVEAAVVAGAGAGRVMLRHVLPNVTAPIIVMGTLGLGHVIIAEAAISFLGFGVPPDVPSWGRMLGEGFGYMLRGPWIAIWPGLAITVTVYGINIFGDGLRDWLDPRLRRR